MGGISYMIYIMMIYITGFGKLPIFFNKVNPFDQLKYAIVVIKTFAEIWLHMQRRRLRFKPLNISSITMMTNYC